MSLSASARKVVEDALVAERSATSARVVALTGGLAAIVEASSMAVADDEHDPEGSTIGFERAQVASLLAEARARLERLDRAHQQLAAGEYGKCKACGRPIPVERLVAHPGTETCVECAEGTAALVHRPGPGR